MIILGVDPHKSSHTAAAVEARATTTLDTITISSATSEYRRLLHWSQRWNERYWAIENADRLGHNLTQWLISHGERVVDIPPTATAKIRALSRGGRRKNDPIDAAAAACIAAIRGESRPVVVEGHTDALALLDERRHTLNRHRTRLLNQLHALLRELIPGGVKRSLSATAAESILRTVTAATSADRVRIQLANYLIDDIRRYDQQLTDNAAQMKQLLDEHTTSLPLPGRCRTRARRPHPGRHPRSAKVPHRGGLRELHRNRAGPGCQWRLQPTSALPLRKPRAQFSDSLHRRHPDPDPDQRRKTLLRPQTRRRKDRQRSHPLPQTPDRYRPLANHDQRLSGTRKHRRSADFHSGLTIQRDHRPHAAAGNPSQPAASVSASPTSWPHTTSLSTSSCPSTQFEASPGRAVMPRLCAGSGTLISTPRGQGRRR